MSTCIPYHYCVKRELKLVAKMLRREHLLLLNLLHIFPLIMCSFDGDCRNDSIHISSCSNQTCRLSSLDLLTIPPDLTHNMEVDIQLCSQHSELRTGMKLRDLSAVHLAGEGGEVQCIGEASGITFIRVHSVWLENIKLRGCGVESSNGETVTTAGIFIIASAGVILDGLTVTDSPGVGVAMRNVSHSDISDCTFTNKNDSVPMKSGLHITVSEDDTSHTINGCIFTGVERVGEYTTGHRWTDDPPMAFTGAGLRLSLLDHATNNSMLVKGCRFTGNSALDGGAMHITVEHSSEGNSMNIERSEFTGNRAGRGGGAIAVGFVSSSSRLETPPVNNNKINIINCNFTHNFALMGGAVHLSSSEALPSCVAIDNEVVLDDCTWEEKMAHFGAAIDTRSIKPQHSVVRYMSLFSITLRDNEFEKNEVYSIGEKGQQTSTLTHGQGTIRTEMTKLCIEGHLLLNKCTGSALYLESTTIEFTPDSNSSFLRNKGYNGGAIALIGQGSVIVVNEGSFIRFCYNRAYSMGGAIFQESSKNCFAVKRGDKPGVFEFVNNTADDKMGHSIFVHSLQECTNEAMDCHKVIESIVKLFANVTRKCDISTQGRDIIVVDHLLLVPGQEVNLTLSINDETCMALPQGFFKLTNKNPTDISVKTGFSSEGRMTITLFGSPGSEAMIAVSPLHQQSIEAVFNVSLSDCPPGYYLNRTCDCCECSAYSQNNTNRYIGIISCTSQFRAQLLHGYWAGYVNDDFKTSYCPKGFCMKTNKTTKDFLLPSTSTDMLNFGCRPNRMGVLCGQCVENHSASFPRFDCKPDRHCNVGWLYYILSQILPVTLVFSVVVAFDVSLTSGAVSGLILYAQMFDFLLLKANNFLWFEPPVYKMLVYLHAIFRMFNLQFFALKNLSFCLRGKRYREHLLLSRVWKGANALDILAFNYVTFIYALLLIIFTVKVVIPCVYKLKQGCGRIRRRMENNSSTSSHDTSTSIIHGLTGFLVLCYSISTNISLHLLATSPLYGGGREYDKHYRVFYNGELEFFSGRHLTYAIPATVFLVLITALPPILLLSYPLCYKVLALCGMEESRFTKLLCRAFPLEKYKPFFDSFQGAFKDKHRYFAGIYFVYRFVWLLTFAYIRELANFYVVLEVELVVMLALNTYMQPYKSNWHNLLDTCIFAILATLNACTIYNYHAKSDSLHPSDLIYSVGTFQIVLAYVPFLYMVLYLTLRAGVLVRKVWRRRRRKGKEEGRTEAEDIEAMEILSSIGARSMSVGYSEFTEESQTEHDTEWHL